MGDLRSPASAGARRLALKLRVILRFMTQIAHGRPAVARVSGGAETSAETASNSKIYDANSTWATCGRPRQRGRGNREEIAQKVS